MNKDTCRISALFLKELDDFRFRRSPLSAYNSGRGIARILIAYIQWVWGWGDDDGCDEEDDDGGGGPQRNYVFITIRNGRAKTQTRDFRVSESQ